jgi:hypothetical protein
MRPDFRLLVKNSWLRIGDIVSFVRFVGVVRKIPEDDFWIAWLFVRFQEQLLASPHKL